MVRARELTSPQNPMVKLMRSLYTRKGRDKTGLVPVEGSRFVNEALLAARRGVTSIEALFYEEGFDEKGSEEQSLLEAAGACACQVFRCSPSLFKTLTSTETPQGIAAAVTRPVFPQRRSSGRELYLVIDRVQDPGNMGTMIRTAAAAGVDGVLCLKGTVDPFNPKTLRATMGAVFRIPITFYDTSLDLLEELSCWGCRLIAADVDGDQFHFQADYGGSIAVIVGNEGQGIDPPLLSAAAVRVRIPLASGVESLNAAVACGILLYEAVRFRHLEADRH
ncbi:MAG: RNA methyltransferase [Firmicutes bacterium]|nr:RNA methyltransferase [Bacillota bacterium]